jgi:hypothetical protein
MELGIVAKLGVHGAKRKTLGDARGWLGFPVWMEKSEGQKGKSDSLLEELGEGLFAGW